MELARYNKWQNSVLYECCDNLDIDSLNRDRGAYFRTLLRTLNHVLHVDQMLLEFIQSGIPPVSFDPNVIPHADYSVLRTARDALDEEILQLTDTSTPEWFDEVFSFYSVEKVRDRHRPRALIISQMFNHQTHHRSQATFMLHQIGVDYGSTDMPSNPLSQS
jgi:uncharacterized damage-inducible protein DinB